MHVKNQDIYRNGFNINELPHSIPRRQSKKMESKVHILAGMNMITLKIYRHGIALIIDLFP